MIPVLHREAKWLVKQNGKINIPCFCVSSGKGTNENVTSFQGETLRGTHFPSDSRLILCNSCMATFWSSDSIENVCGSPAAEEQKRRNIQAL